MSVNVESKEGFTPLHTASIVGSAEAVSALLKLGADKDHTSSTGVTPPHMAAK